VSEWIPKLPPRSATPSPWKNTSKTSLISTAHKSNTIATSKAIRKENPFSKSEDKIPAAIRRRTPTSKEDSKKMVKILEDQIQALLVEKSKAMAAGEEDRATYILEEVCKLQDQLTQTIRKT
jgi:hypothetical protein